MLDRGVWIDLDGEGLREALKHGRGPSNPLKHPNKNKKLADSFFIQRNWRKQARKIQQLLLGIKQNVNTLLHSGWWTV